MPNRLTYLHIILFIATFITTTIAGTLLNGIAIWETPEKIYLGLPFSLTLLTILMIHESSHYYFSRKHRVSATLPYFIPAPSIIGTFGAIIKMKAPMPDRLALLDIGASGPIGGFIVAVIASAVGLSLSEIRPHGEIQDGIAFGTSILFSLISEIVLNADPETHDIILHPIAFAGWIGFLVTSLNLLPIGQLDGGHIVYALFGKKHEIISKTMLPVLIIMGVYFWPGWLIWAALMIMIGYKHPPVLYPYVRLDSKRRFTGWVSLAIFVLTFTPAPIQGM